MSRNKIVALCIGCLLAVGSLLLAQAPAVPSPDLDPLQHAQNKYVCYGPAQCAQICSDHGCTSTGVCGTASGSCVCECS
jgi:hypothetical protein